MKRLTLSVVLAAAACGSNNNTPTLSPGTRAVIAAPPAMFGPPPGIMSALDVPSQEVVKNLAAGVVGSDPFLRMYGNMLYVINRDDGDNITVVDANTITLVT